eukprot:364256-Chlamydomonas_euryale.AAC.2
MPLSLLGVHTCALPPHTACPHFLAPRSNSLVQAPSPNFLPRLGLPSSLQQCVGFTYVASGPNAVCCYFKHTEAPLVAFRTGNGVRDCGVSYRRVRPAGSVRELLSSTPSLSTFYQLMEYATNPATGTLVDDAFAVWDFQRLTWIFDKADGDVTVLAPTDAAYSAAGLTADGVKASSPNLYKYLLAHILPEPLPLSALLGAPGADYMSLHAPVHYIASVDIVSNTVALDITGLPAPQRVAVSTADLVAGSSFIHAINGFVSASMDAGSGGGGIGDLLGGLLRRLAAGGLAVKSLAAGGLAARRLAARGLAARTLAAGRGCRAQRAPPPPSSSLRPQPSTFTSLQQCLRAERLPPWVSSTQTAVPPPPIRYAL